MEERVEGKQGKSSWKIESSKMVALPEYDMEELKKSSQYLLMSPNALSRFTKSNCLCSPTTHVGSFRCRRHRSSAMTRGGSVGSNLSDLARKSEAAGDSV